ncbi:universal stress protein [Haladaptatus sp. DYSN1]|uniref:universal stress protein n=1 Tax=unclassified Haladaptatus TaxID=2622732 RepID=UPI0024072F8E|nr:universal stress protein [Haladaptatus sp. DYSN1]
MSANNPDRPLTDAPDNRTAVTDVDEARILFLCHGDHPDRVVDLAADLARDEVANLYLLLAVSAPEQTPLELVEPPCDARRDLAQYELKIKTESADSIGVHSLIRYGRKHDNIVQSVLDNDEINTLVTEDVDDSSLLDVFRSVNPDERYVPADSDIVIASHVEYLNAINSILVPIAGEPHSGMAIEVAHALASQNNAWIELFHVIDHDASDHQREQAEKYISAGLDRVEEFDDTDTWLLEDDDVADAIIEQSQYYDLTVLGAPQKGRLRRFAFGSTTSAVQEDARSVVITVRRNTDESWLGRWVGRGT